MPPKKTPSAAAVSSSSPMPPPDWQGWNPASQQHQGRQHPVNLNPSMNTSVDRTDPSLLGTGASGKVAIPPLRRHTNPNAPSGSSEKKRTQRACVECRARKIKCSGRRPTCDHCEQSQLPCIYTEGKREQNKKDLERGGRMIGLLRDIMKRVFLPHDLKQRVEALENEIAADDESVISTLTTGSHKRRRSTATTSSDKRIRSASASDDEPEEMKEEADVSAEVGSEESVDLAHEDFNRSERARATGFIGKSSELAWAQRLAHEQHTDPDKTTGRSIGPYGKPWGGSAAQRLPASRKRNSEDSSPDEVADFTFHLDEQEVLEVEYVDQNELPPADTATKLFQSYMDTVHAIFPILNKAEFTAKFTACVNSQDFRMLTAKWRAILNLVFAIGARFSHLVNADWAGDERDHRIYYTRARFLCMDDDAKAVHADLERIQILGLTAFYYMVISQINRCFITVGLACRQAVALGLHLRNQNPSTSAIEKEHVIRIWWSLYYLEHLLCEMTGRPTAVNHQFCSVPMPAPIDEETLSTRMGALKLENWNKKNEDYQLAIGSTDVEAGENPEGVANVASHFRHRIQLSIITQKIFANLYSAGTVFKSWEAAQKEIVALGEEVDEWYRNLPKDFRFGRASNPQFERERILLGFMFYSTKIILNRPCLCRLDLRMKRQGTESKHVNDKAARDCVVAAKSMANLLPEKIDPKWLYHNGPWWCVIHHIMQALTICMLELAFHGRHMAEPQLDVKSIFQVAKKLISWIRKIAEGDNEAAKKARKQAEMQFKGFQNIGWIDTTELTNIAEEPSTQQPPSRSAHHQQQTSQGVPGNNPAGNWTTPHDTRMDRYSAQLSESLLGQQETGFAQLMPQGHHMIQGSGAEIQQDLYPDPHIAPRYDIVQTWQPQHAQQSHLQEPWQQTVSAGPGTNWPVPSIDDDWNTMVWRTTYDEINPFVPATAQLNAGFMSSTPPGQQRHEAEHAAGPHMAVAGSPMTSHVGYGGHFSIGSAPTEMGEGEFSAMGPSGADSTQYPQYMPPEDEQ